MIELCVTEDRTVDMVGYSAGATLGELIERVNAFYLDKQVGDTPCAGCGRCCGDPIALSGHDLRRLSKTANDSEMADGRDIFNMPSMPDMADRRRGIEDMCRQHGFDRNTATLLYEYNAADPIRLAKRDDGMCVFLSPEGLCTIYRNRPLICRLYVCKAGERLSGLHESVVSQIAWHGYQHLGWIEQTELAHNPFVRCSEEDSIRISEFDSDLSEALEKLFYFF